MVNQNGTHANKPFPLDERRNPPPSPYFAAGAPLHCAFCNGTFRLHDGRLSCWRGSDDRYYCSDECAASQRRKKRAA